VLIGAAYGVFMAVPNGTNLQADLLLQLIHFRAISRGKSDLEEIRVRQGINVATEPRVDG
jgi:hypothetical protein